MQSTPTNNERSSSCIKFTLSEIRRATNEFSNLRRDVDGMKFYLGSIIGDSYTGIVSVTRLTEDADAELETVCFQNEIELLSDCNHANIISLFGYCDELEEKILVHEFMPNGSLYDYLYTNKISTLRLTVEQRLKICIDVANGLNYLHSGTDFNIIHSNLKPENILLDINLEAKISGFGLSRTFVAGPSTSQKFSSHCRGTRGYIGPECFEDNYKLSRKSDVYSFGVVLLEVLCERPGWDNLVIASIPFILRGELPTFASQYVIQHISLECSQSCANLITDCLDSDLDRRPYMNQVINELLSALELQKKNQDTKIRANSQQTSPANTQRSSSSCLKFTLPELKQATYDLSHSLGEVDGMKFYRGSISGDSYSGIVSVACLTEDSEEENVNFQNEIEILSACNHANIISLVGYCDEPEQKILVHEFMPNGSLYDYLYTNKDTTPRLTVEQRLEICIDVANGLNYLHSGNNFNVIHSNLKPESILLDSNLRAKIFNFRFSRSRDAGPSTSQQITDTVKGTDGYVAPECYDRGYKPSRKCDVYSFAVLLLELLCERPGWKQLVILALPFIMRGELPNFTPEDIETNISLECSNICVKLIMDCLEYDADKRPYMNQVVDDLQLALTEQKQYQNNGQQSSHMNNQMKFCKKFLSRDIRRATDEFASKNMIGRGEYSVVYLGNFHLIRYEGVVAIKRVNMEQRQAIQAFKKEIQVLSGCVHDNIISLVGICNELAEKIIVYEYMPYGSLHNYLYRDKDHGCNLTVEQRLEICIGVAKGLIHLHSERIIHFSLKPENILLDHNLVAKISGFGLYSLICSPDPSSSPQVLDSIIGTDGYVAPECLESNCEVSPAADVYSFGVILLEVLCEKPAWKGLVLLANSFILKGEFSRATVEQVEKIVSPQCSRALENIVRDCLDSDPDNRPSMNQVLDELLLALKLQKQNQDALTQQYSGTNIQDLTSSYLSFSLEEIKRATDDFANENCLGEGGFGKVFRGHISEHGYNGLVAVKQLKMGSNQGVVEFQKEIDLLSACNHASIISLVGTCSEGSEKILVYEFMEKGSLGDYLYENRDCTPRLTIEQRLEICIGVAQGLDYLHSGSKYNIIHSDLKTDNILLDADFVPKIADFGLSRTRPAGPSGSELVTKYTHEGYIAPECYEPNYKLSRKADVYAFGVVFLEVLCEKPAWKRLVIMALQSILKGELPKFTPEYVKANISPRCSRTCEYIIKDCLDINPEKRPSMNQVVDKLVLALKQQKTWMAS
ncbi:uncharacterized protein [Rutidosis leptorrhynchoides]|uniref:uncharacterized protein isoform X2 n=1 Tax=Rutidosis leptorrhynchoides TaxID=125765 RepID=UPI003A99E431